MNDLAIGQQGETVAPDRVVQPRRSGFLAEYAARPPVSPTRRRRWITDREVEVQPLADGPLGASHSRMVADSFKSDLHTCGSLDCDSRRLSPTGLTRPQAYDCS